MRIEDIEKLERTLEGRGYKKIASCKVTEEDDYEWYKAFRDENGDLKYQIFFEIWDFRKYGEEHVGVSVTVMPESVKDGVGRRDLKLSVTWTEDVERVEDAAEKFYDFVKSID